MRRLALIAALGAALAASGCGGISSGPVVSKEYQPAQSYFMVQYIPMSCGQNCTTNIPIMYWIEDGEDWVLHLKNDEGETGEAYVSQAEFDRTQVGDVYTAPGDEAPKDASYAETETHRPDR